jgi:hypothetical protein
MFRFKLGIGIGFSLGWLVGSGKAAELIEQFRQRRASTDAPGLHAVTDASSHVYDFAVRAAE